MTIAAGQLMETSPFADEGVSGDDWFSCIISAGHGIPIFAKVKKRVLDEMEVPPEAHVQRETQSLRMEFCFSVEGVFPLYRDRFTNEMMMYLRPGQASGTSRSHNSISQDGHHTA